MKSEVKKKPVGIQTTGKIGGVQRTHVLKKRRSVVHNFTTLYIKPLTYSTLGKKGKPGLCEGLSRIRGKGTGGGGGGKEWGRGRGGGRGEEENRKKRVERRRIWENAGEECPRALQLGLAVILHHGRLPYRFPMLYTSTFGPLWS